MLLPQHRVLSLPLWRFLVDRCLVDGGMEFAREACAEVKEMTAGYNEAEFLVGGRHTWTWIHTSHMRMHTWICIQS